MRLELRAFWRFDPDVGGSESKVVCTVEASFRCFRRNNVRSEGERPGSLNPGLMILITGSKGGDGEAKLRGGDIVLLSTSSRSTSAVFDLNVRLLLAMLTKRRVSIYKYNCGPECEIIKIVEEVFKEIKMIESDALKMPDPRASCDWQNARAGYEKT